MISKKVLFKLILYYVIITYSIYYFYKIINNNNTCIYINEQYLNYIKNILQNNYCII